MKWVSNKKIALAIFKKHSPSDSKVIKIKRIHTGYTNKNFKITTEDGKSYQLRYSSLRINELVDRKNEVNILKALNLPEYKYMNDTTGIVIKDWIEGLNLNSWNENTLKLLVEQIKILHAIKPSHTHIKRFDPLEYIDNKNDLQDEYKNKYRDLVYKYEKEHYVICHNDINGSNLVFNKKENKITLIDYEWSRKNHPYWELANFSREEKLDQYKTNYLFKLYDPQYNESKINDFLFMSTLFAYTWCFSMPKTSKIKKYKKSLIPILEKYYRKLAN